MWIDIKAVGCNRPAPTGRGGEMNIKEFKQWWNRFRHSGYFPEPKVEHINLLLAEVERLTAAIAKKDAEYRKAEIEANSLAVSLYKQFYRNDAPQWKTLDTVAGVITQINNMTSGICVELVKAKNLAGKYLADQEAIERHTRRETAREIVDIMNHCETFQDVKTVIWHKYGVE